MLEAAGITFEDVTERIAIKKFWKYCRDQFKGGGRAPPALREPEGLPSGIELNGPLFFGASRRSSTTRAAGNINGVTTRMRAILASRGVRWMFLGMFSLSLIVFVLMQELFSLLPTATAMRCRNSKARHQ